MKRMNLRRLTSFYTFDLPVNYKYLYTIFRQTQEGQHNVHSCWPIAATRQKLISDYWGNALLHYLLLIALSVVVVLLFTITYGYLGNIYLPVLFLVGILAYLPMYFIIYRPTFLREFLPNLETVIAEYEGRERLKLDKCKQDQPTNRALAFLFYVLNQTSKMSYLSASSKCADMLHKIFGVSQKGMQNELDLIYKQSKRKKLESRQLLEVSKGFEEAYTLLEDMHFTEGIRELKILEQRFKEDFNPKKQR